MNDPWDTAIDAVRQRWGTGRLMRPDGRMCALGAIGYALWGEEWITTLTELGYADGDDFLDDGKKTIERLAQEPMVHDLAAVIREQNPHVRYYKSDTNVVFSENDMWSRKAEDMIAYMEKARAL